MALETITVTTLPRRKLSHVPDSSKQQTQQTPQTPLTSTDNLGTHSLFQVPCFLTSPTLKTTTTINTAHLHRQPRDPLPIPKYNNPTPLAPWTAKANPMTPLPGKGMGEGEPTQVDVSNPTTHATCFLLSIDTCLLHKNLHFVEDRFGLSYSTPHVRSGSAFLCYYCT
jgi:hypothetical protein